MPEQTPHIEITTLDFTKFEIEEHHLEGLVPDAEDCDVDASPEWRVIFVLAALKEGFLREHQVNGLLPSFYEIWPDPSRVKKMIFDGSRNDLGLQEKAEYTSGFFVDMYGNALDLRGDDYYAFVGALQLENGTGRPVSNVALTRATRVPAPRGTGAHSPYKLES